MLPRERPEGLCVRRARLLSGQRPGRLHRPGGVGVGPLPLLHHIFQEGVGRDRWEVGTLSAIDVGVFEKEPKHCVLQGVWQTASTEGHAHDKTAVPA